MLSIDKTERLRGTVKWFNNAKGFGFIIHESGADVFVHFTNITQPGFKTLQEGEQVEYELLDGPKGLHAARVTRLTASLPRVVIPLQGSVNGVTTISTVPYDLSDGSPLRADKGDGERAEEQR